jgi:hypothetical protein
VPGKPEEPPGTECPDGAEEWRPHGPKKIFLIPRQGEKIQVTRTVAFDSLDDWLAQWEGLDHNGKPSPDGGPGVPPSVFRRLDLARRQQIIKGVKDSRDEQVITITLPLQARTIQCRRKWVCRNGRWEQTNECDAIEDIGENQDRKFELKGNALSPNQLEVLLKRAIAAWKAAEEANEQRKKAAEDCSTC